MGLVDDNMVSIIQARLVATYLNDITVPEAIWAIHIDCAHRFCASVVLTGVDGSVEADDIPISVSGMMWDFETELDVDGIQHHEIRLSWLGKELLNRVAEDGRQILAGAA